MGDHRPAMRRDDAERLASEPAAAAVGLDPTRQDPLLVPVAEIDVPA
jgi:hypothetical protein